MKRRFQATALLLAVATTAMLAAACADSATAPTLPAGVVALRESLTPFTSLALAKDAGYSTALTDCMSNGDVGAMGVHYANTALLDAVADSLHPEVLIYEPGTDGQSSLVGVEFVVPFAARSRDAAPPVLFGHAFAKNDLFGVWALHVWTHRINPSGTFADWNPRVHC